MNKNRVKTILIVLIVLLCLNVGVYAALSATEVNYTKSTGTTVTVKAALDELYTKVQVPTYEIGDEVKVGGEQFYVLGWDNNCDTVDLIAKYNLNKDGTAQVDAGRGTTACAFSSTYYWSSSYSSFTGTYFNLNDCIGFTETDVLGIAKKYGRSKGAVATRLMYYNEAAALNFEARSNEKIKTMLWGKANSAEGCLFYWLGTSEKANTVSAFMGSIGSFNNSDFQKNNSYGVRPVITVLKSKIS